MGTIVRSLGHCPSESQLQEAKVPLTILFFFQFCFSGDRWDGGPWADGLHPPRSIPPSHVQVRNFLFFFALSHSLQHLVSMWFRRNFKKYLNSLNHRQDHPSREVLACRSRRSLGGIPGEWRHLWRSDVCVACNVLVCPCMCAFVKSSRVHVSDGNLRPSMLTTPATSTRRSSPRSSLRKAKHSRRSCKFSFLFFWKKRAFQNLFSLGGDARVLQRCPRPGDQVSSLQGVCSLSLRRRQLLNDLSYQSQTVFK